MKLKALLTSLGDELVQTRKKPLGNIEIRNISKDSRTCVRDTLFVCLRGYVFDGNDYIEEATARGATAVVTDRREGSIWEAGSEVPVIVVKDARKALAILAAVFYGEPAKSIRLIGITGTKGKTTTAYMIRTILQESGYRTGLIGTIEIRIGEESFPTRHTSPESLDLQYYLRKMVDAGCEFAVLEVSSQALKLHRTWGLLFEVGVFTNLSEDHLGANEHPNMEDYLESKALLFRQSKRAVGNADSAWFDRIFQTAVCPITTVGIRKKADFTAENIKLEREEGNFGISYRLVGGTHGMRRIRLPFPGMFNVSNSLLAMAVCDPYMGEDENPEQALLRMRIRGRMEPVLLPGGALLFIDYAHNAASLKHVLETTRAYGPNRIFCIFGCGGNRAKGRRIEMGKVSGSLSDVTIVTTDNPRTEAPSAIMDDICTGIRETQGSYVRIENRKEAIRYALLHVEKEDVIILAGKGHETYQEIDGIRYHMDDRELVEEAWAEIEKERTCTQTLS